MKDFKVTHEHIDSKIWKRTCLVDMKGNKIIEGDAVALEVFFKNGKTKELFGTFKGGDDDILCFELSCPDSYDPPYSASIPKKDIFSISKLC